MPAPPLSTTNQLSQNNNAEREESSKELEIILRWAVRFIGSLTGLCLLFIFLFFSKKAIYFAMGNYLIISSALFVAGCILGFLFGIPKVLKESSSSTVGSFSDNANLEEISDWLTKIIVGLTLVQFNHIKAMLIEAANRINMTFQTDGFDFFVVGYAAIIFYISSGFLLSYFWTRTNYVYILAKGKRDVGDLEKRIDVLQKMNLEQNVEIQKAEKEKVILEEKTEKLKEAVQREGNIRLVKENPFVETQPSGDDDGEELKKLVAKLLLERKVIIPDDPHKGRWGGSAESNFRKLDADVTLNPNYADIYDVKVIVSSTDPESHPLDKTVALLLHDSFTNDILYLKPNNNKAEVTLLAYEAFTVAAIGDNGDTMLELDLNNRPNNPPGFNYPDPQPVSPSSSAS